MKNILLIILLSLASCKKSTIHNSNPISKSNSEKKSIKNKAFDSLVKYSSLNEFLLRDDDEKFVLYGTSINDTKIAFIAVTDSTLYLYQKKQNKWVLNDSIPFDTYAFSYKISDLNGDNKNDFIIYSFADVHGQSIPFVFICDDNNILKYRKDIKLYNMSYDNTTELVRSYYESCAYCVDTKELYRWVNDSLKLVERVELDMTKEQIKTKYYKPIKGKLVNYKTVNDDSNYDNALWVDDCQN